MAIDPWQRLPMAGQVRLEARLPGQNLPALHAIARGRMTSLREQLLAPDPVLEDLRAAIERRDDAAQELAAQAAMLAAGQQELREIQESFAQIDRDGVLVAPSWIGEAYARVQIEGSAMTRWQMLAGERLDRLAPAVLALEEAMPAMQADFEEARAARIMALVRKLQDQHGFAWTTPPRPDDEICPAAIRAATLMATNGTGCSVMLRWRHDGVTGQEHLSWTLHEGAARHDGSAEDSAIPRALHPISLAA